MDEAIKKACDEVKALAEERHRKLMEPVMEYGHWSTDSKAGTCRAKPYVCGYDPGMKGSMTVIVMECNEPVSIQEALEHLKSMAAGSVSKVKRVTVEMAE